MSAADFVPVLSSRTYGTPFAFKNDCSVPKLTAKFTFCGMSPTTSAIFNAFNLLTTTPATLPFSPNSGPPPSRQKPNDLVSSASISPEIGSAIPAVR
jgi:hypothetical protein